MAESLPRLALRIRFAGTAAKVNETVAGCHERGGARVGFTFEISGGREGLTVRE